MPPTPPVPNNWVEAIFPNGEVPNIAVDDAEETPTVIPLLWEASFI